jgi:hypothetical protein
MNAPTPHIGSTLAQRAILRYRLEQRELDAERERLERTAAALQVDALLDRVSQPEPCNFCAPVDDVPKAITGTQLAIAGALWLACMLGSLWLCTSAGMAFLDALWGAK